MGEKKVNRKKIKKLKKALKVIYYFILIELLNPKQSGLDPYKKSPVKRFLTEKLPGNHQSAVKVHIKGKVNDVGYRRWLKRKATLEKIKCYFYTKGGKEVKAIIIGHHSKLEPFIKEAWKGNQKSKVERIDTFWFNKPVKEIALSNDTSDATEDIGWSQETVDLFLNTLDYLKPIMQKYNEYEDLESISNSSEIERARKNRKSPGFKMGNLNYFMLKDRYLGTQNSLSSNVNSIIRSIGDHKQLTKDKLSQAKLPTPKGEIFTEYEEAVRYFKKHKFPFVIKPVSGSYGDGITVDVRTTSSFKVAWNYAKQYHEQIILEEMVKGIDMRILVAGGKSVAALLRVPANIIGDGKNTIRELIEMKNEKRLKNPRLKKALIIPDGYTEAFLKRQGYHFESIVPKNEVVFLHLKANIQAGADSIGVMEYMHPDLLELASEAAKAFDVTDYWGVDLMVERLDKPRNEQSCKIIEMNSRANIYNVQFPIHGQENDAAQALVDYFESLSKDNNETIQSLKIKITGLLRTQLMEEIVNKARNYNLNGKIIKRSYTKKTSALELSVEGEKYDIIAFINDLYLFRNEKKGIIDGVTLQPVDHLRHEHLKEIETDDSDDMQYKIITPLKLDEIKVSQTQLIETYGSPEEDNRQLFLMKLREKGFKAEHLYEELIKITDSKKGYGIVGYRHSSIFADTVTERLYPLKRILALNGLPISRGVRFRVAEQNQAIAYFNYFKVKLIATRILADELYTRRISTAKELKKFWKISKKLGANYIYLERETKGYKVCIPVIGESTCGALLLKPTQIVGDGKKTIEQLIQAKNKERQKNTWYQNQLIEWDQRLKNRLDSKALGANSILPKGEVFQLENSLRFTLGGESYNIENQMHQDFKKYAVQAVKSIPGLKFAFVYMTIPEPQDTAQNQQWVIDQIDSNPRAMMFHYPWRGKTVDLAGKVLDELSLGSNTIWMQTEEEK